MFGAYMGNCIILSYRTTAKASIDHPVVMVISFTVASSVYFIVFPLFKVRVQLFCWDTQLMDHKPIVVKRKLI